MWYVRTPSTFDDSILKPCFEARTLMKPLTEWACHLKAFINAGSVAPPARDNSFTTSSRTVFEAFLGLGCFRPDVAFLRAAFATLGLSGLRTAQNPGYRHIARFGRPMCAVGVLTPQSEHYSVTARSGPPRAIPVRSLSSDHALEKFSMRKNIHSRIVEGMSARLVDHCGRILYSSREDLDLSPLDYPKG